MGTDSSMVAARGWGREIGNYGLRGTEFQFCKRKVFWLHDNMNALTATELHT